MRTIVHLSDLHFGRVDAATLDPLARVIRDLRPRLVAISGDLTQRARVVQFAEARAFLDRLPKPVIVVPGNHDIPLDDVASRFLRPLSGYRRYITDDLEPFYSDEEIAVAGVNTARSLTWKGGRINVRQVEAIERRLCQAGNVTKIIVTHHPFDLPEGVAARSLVGRASMAMKRLAVCGADVFLAGHLHLSYTVPTAARYAIQGHSALVVQAGTATSTRGRGEANAFNVIVVDRPNIEVGQYAWRPTEGVFALCERERFHYTTSGWAPA